MELGKSRESLGLCECGVVLWAAGVDGAVVEWWWWWVCWVKAGKLSLPDPAELPGGTKEAGSSSQLWGDAFKYFMEKITFS